MISETNAYSLYQKNVQRTQSLLEAIDKIQAYNTLYQNNQESLQDYHIVKSIQDTQFIDINQSLGEHAIISLATAFETYYRELLQELIYRNPNYFQQTRTKHTEKISELMNSPEEINYEGIEKKLKLRNRFDYCQLFIEYSINFLSSEECNFIEDIYQWRNNFVHSASRFQEGKSTTLDASISTEAKRLKTRLLKTINNIHKRIGQTLDLSN